MASVIRLIASSSLLFISAVFALGFSAPPGYEEIRILNAEDITYDRYDPVLSDAQVLTGNVRFKHNNSTMYCDYAHFFSHNNSLNAYKRVKIVQGDSLKIFADTLYYDGNTKIARLRGKVIMRKGSTVLKTSYLDYSTATQEANYYNGGVIDNEKDKSTITSVLGTYFNAVDEFIFTQNVQVLGEKYTINTEKLKFNTATKTAHFIVPTVILSDSNRILTSNGYYNTENEFAKLLQGSWIYTKNQKMTADFIFYDKRNQVGEAFNYVEVWDTVKNMTLFGDHAVFFQKEKLGIFSRKPYAMKLSDDRRDTMYLAADTIRAFQDSLFVLHQKPENPEEDKKKSKKKKKEKVSKENLARGEYKKFNNLQAFRSVKIFGSAFQGVADSLNYIGQDSVMIMYPNPILWSSSDRSQLQGDSVVMKLNAKQQVETVDVFAPEPISSSKPYGKQATEEEFNQLKGKHITAYFQENKVQKIWYQGPSEVRYYIGEQQADSTWEKVGMNKGLSASDVLMHFQKEGGLDRIVFNKQPRAIVYPTDSIPENERYVEGFKWLEDKKPKSKTELIPAHKLKPRMSEAYEPDLSEISAPEVRYWIAWERGIALPNVRKNTAFKKKK
jgi:lipopolysaccharide export system protein LptA